MIKNVTDPINPDTSLKAKAVAKKHFGTFVTEKVRKMMFNILREMLNDYRHLINTKMLVTDICNLVQQKNGKIAADTGCHDDMVMAYLHTLYILKYGYAIERFGVHKHLCTYTKSGGEIMQEYENKVQEDVIDNSKEYNPDDFESQMYKDLTSRVNEELVRDNGGYDEYGYNPSQYTPYGGAMRQPEVVHSTASDLSFFRDIQTY